MKILPTWLREFVDVPVDDRKFAEDLTAAGVAVEGFSTVDDENVYEVELTPNRVDAMNHYGIARDASAIYDVELKPLALGALASGGKSAKDVFPIEIHDAQGCARYTARAIRNIKIGPSAANVAKRLELLESSSISNAVDASNYTLQEMGHPTHAFDLETLAGGKIIVRRARAGEILRTLDGVERKLHADDLVIADAERPVALAGVMGGFDTMITERTRHVLIESAWFDPASIRRTAKRHGMHTDASHRFERGADWGATSVACARVAELILAWAGGEPLGGEIDVIARTVATPTLELRRSEVRRILGEDIPEQDIARILRRLGFGVTIGASHVGSPKPASLGARAAMAEEVDVFTVQVPTWRLDVEREIDLVEEIARIYGYNRFANTLPAFAGSVIERPHAREENAVRSTLLALGYNEAVSLTFISREDATSFSHSTPVAIANPLSEEAALMRTSLVPSMLGMLARNLNRGNNTARLFEKGHTYELVGERTEEHEQLCVGATGDGTVSGVHQPPRPYSFFDMKGDVEDLLAEFAHRTLYFDALVPSYYHPGRAARAVIDGMTIAYFGEVHPDIATSRKLKQPVYVAEILLERLYRQGLRNVRYRPIPRFPAAERDFSFVFSRNIFFEAIQAAVNRLKIATLRSFVPVEIFHGGSLAPDQYSILLRATFQSNERTLRDDEVAQWSALIIEALQAVGGTQRA